MRGEDLIDLGHRAKRALDACNGVHHKAAKMLGLTEPTFRRHLRILEFPVEALYAYREGRISRTLMEKLVMQPAERREALWVVLRRQGRLKHSDLRELTDEPTVLVQRLQATVRKLRERGMSERRIHDLVSRA